ncbi:putative potassium transporter 4 [Camellia lanceoleosa]|uniref:Potassium transporter 4 n=1 Tax=Camellia lanceoleosa TaxID=1840588 RepID=A0ACC0FY48_9ERIC|nr:putative potassium transporter 4 [Camellia lanceoleosa]
MVVHTSSKKEGEVYCLEINYILMILCVAVILIFGDGKDIGNAFGDDFVGQVIDRLQAHIQNGSDYATLVTSELEEEIFDMEEAKLTGAVNVRGKTRSALPAMGTPLLQYVEVGMLYEV